MSVEMTVPPTPSTNVSAKVTDACPGSRCEVCSDSRPGNNCSNGKTPRKNLLPHQVGLAPPRGSKHLSSLSLPDQARSPASSAQRGAATLHSVMIINDAHISGWQKLICFAGHVTHKGHDSFMLQLCGLKHHRSMAKRWSKLWGGAHKTVKTCHAQRMGHALSCSTVASTRLDYGHRQLCVQSLEQRILDIFELGHDSPGLVA